MSVKFKDLKKEYDIDLGRDLGHIRLISDHKEHKGIGILEHHKWYVYSLCCDKEFPFGYTQVLFIPQKVSEDIREKIKYVVQSGVSFNIIKDNNELPHIDAKTGNIHSMEFNVDKLEEQEVSQIVWCFDGHSGPGLKKECVPKCLADLYRYKVNVRYVSIDGKERKQGKRIEVENGDEIYVPKASYYPLYRKNGDVIEAIDEVKFKSHESQRLNAILGSIWKQIN